MAETFFQQANRLRNRYLSIYRRSIEEWKTETRFAVEILVQPDGRTTPSPFCLTRIDIISGEPTAPNLIRVADSLEEPGSSATFQLPNGLEVQQDGFSWEALQLSFLGPQFEIDRLQGWLKMWLDADEVREPDASGLSGVVHDLAWTTDHGMWQLDVDLGSAPIEALEALLSDISAAGVTSVRLSRHDGEPL